MNRASRRAEGENVDPNNTLDRSPRKRQYPAFYERAVPVALTIVVIAIAILLAIIVGVALGLFPGLG
jgi:hypothetical protein